MCGCTRYLKWVWGTHLGKTTPTPTDYTHSYETTSTREGDSEWGELPRLGYHQENAQHCTQYNHHSPPWSRPSHCPWVPGPVQRPTSHKASMGVWCQDPDTTASGAGRCDTALRHQSPLPPRSL